MAALDIIAPLEQEGTKSVVRKWLVAVGDAVALNDPIVELETDKVSVEVAAEAAGILCEILLPEGEQAEPGAVLARMTPSDGAAEKAAAPDSDPPAASAGTPPSQPVPLRGGRALSSFDPALRLSPSVRRRLIEADADPEGMTGTGRDGRLTRADVDRHLSSSPVAKRAVEGARGRAPTTPAVPAFAFEGGVSAIPHDSMRLRIAEHMAMSVREAPHVTAVFEADFSAIMAHRRAHKADFERRGVNLTLTAYIAAAACEAMKVSPTVNARWFEDRLEVYEDVNLGVGVALADKGLIVPVVKRAQALDLFGLAQGLHDLTERARTGALKPRDVQCGTFSISNHGVSGSLIASPIIINQPQSAILGVGKLEKRVVVRTVDGADAMLIKPMAYVSLTIDHRVLDGHQTNAWLTRFVEVLETWPAA